MKSLRPKVLHRVAGKPMIEYVLEVAGGLGPKSVTLVVGHLRETLQQALAARANLRFVAQEPQLGTGHALLQAPPLLVREHGVVVVVSGDVPLVTRHTVDRALARHRTRGAAATAVPAVVDQPA